MYPEGNTNLLKALWKDLLKHSKNKALNLEHKDPFDFHFSQRSSSWYKKQIEDIVVRWVCQPQYHADCNPIHWEIRNSSPCLTDWVFIQYHRCGFRNNLKSTYTFANQETSPIHLKRLTSIVKSLALGNRSPSWRNLHPFPVPLRYNCSIWSSPGTTI